MYLYNVDNARCLTILNFSDVDECLSIPCQNNATCTDMIDGYNCTCTSGFKGESCEISK